MRIRLAVPADADCLFDVWLRSVRATHLFLSEADIQALMPHVREYLLMAAATLWVLEEDDGAAVGFMGLTGGEIDSLFLAPEFQRRGGGRALVEHARTLAGKLTVSVNEQNPGAVRFYEACGFVVIGRSDVDSAGRPFPLLHMRRADEA